MCSSMAEAEAEAEPSHIKPHQKCHQNPENNQTKFFNNFLYKVALVVVFFVILPLFPSQAPDFINQSLITRSWELLHLLLVGIAVSYGLFSRLSEKVDKQSNGKFDSNAHNYVSRILEVPTVFDDEGEASSSSLSLSLSLSHESDESKVQHAWSSQYFRNEPEVVVAQEHSIVDERPLLLPVRSLKQEKNESLDEARSNSVSSSRRVSSKSVIDHQELLEEKLKESVVLPSPIPWRSRSGRLMQEKNDEPFFSITNPSSPKMSPSASLSSPKKLFPAASLPMEAQSKSGEDVGRKRSFYKASIPPPPPPPPMFYKSSSLRPRSDDISYEKDLRRSFTSSESRGNQGIEGNHRLSHVDGIPMAKSVRTTRGGEQGYASENQMEQSAKEVEANSVENVTRKRVGFDKSSLWTNENLKSSHFEEFFQEDEKEDLFDKVVMNSDEESESEDDETEGGDTVESPKPSPMPYQVTSGSASDAGPDVDKKADEFIAKFREQIRLQRIDLIKKSSAQISKNLSR